MFGCAVLGYCCVLMPCHDTYVSFVVGVAHRHFFDAKASAMECNPFNRDGAIAYLKKITRPDDESLLRGLLKNVEADEVGDGDATKRLRFMVDLVAVGSERRM